MKKRGKEREVNWELIKISLWREKEANGLCTSLSAGTSFRGPHLTGNMNRM
jgi:hypothetical protein